MQCVWCLQEDVPLVDHHYPVPQSEGGTETVCICRNCHGKTHTDWFFDASEARTPEEYAIIVMQRQDYAIRKTFPGLWKQGWEVFPANNAYTLTPPWMWKGLTDAQKIEAVDALSN